MRLLLDTCALAELNKPRPDPAVVATIQATADESLFVSVVSLGEIVKGISLLPVGKRREGFEEWLDILEKSFYDRILGIDHKTAKIWGELTALAQKRGNVVSACDGLIAATAIRHGLHVLTRNENDFRATGASIKNPWNSSAK